MKTTYTDGTTPAILKMGREWKLSPYGPENPDKDCRWFGTKAEAVAEADKLRELYLTPDVLALFDALAADERTGADHPCSAATSVGIPRTRDTSRTSRRPVSSRPRKTTTPARGT
jgi:hypothetical protein